MGVDSAWSDHQLLSDLLISQAFGHEAKYLKVYKKIHKKMPKKGLEQVKKVILTRTSCCYDCHSGIQKQSWIYSHLHLGEDC